MAHPLAWQRHQAVLASWRAISEMVRKKSGGGVSSPP